MIQRFDSKRITFESFQFRMKAEEMNINTYKDTQEEEGSLSNCCGASNWLDMDICADCKEHADFN